MSFLKRGGGQKPATADPDALAVEQLRKAGADPSMPHETSHFLYVPGVKAAQQVARSFQLITDAALLAGHGDIKKEAHHQQGNER